jgi:hypothetical protein
VIDMSGMLRPSDLYPEELRLHHDEVQRSVRAGALNRMANEVRDQAHEHGRTARILSLATPAAVVLGILAFIN